FAPALRSTRSLAGDGTCLITRHTYGARYAMGLLIPSAVAHRTTADGLARRAMPSVSVAPAERPPTTTFSWSRASSSYASSADDIQSSQQRPNMSDGRVPRPGRSGALTV